MVIADYIGSSRCNSTINELIVVGVCRNQVKTIERCDTFHIGQWENKFYYIGDYFNNNKGKFKLDSKLFRQFKVKRLDDRSDAAVYLARFYYKDDLYEVLFGYGIDPSPKYLYGKKSYHNACTDCFNKSYHKNGKCKGLLRKIRKWYNNY